MKKHQTKEIIKLDLTSETWSTENSSQSLQVAAAAFFPLEALGAFVVILFLDLDWPALFFFFFICAISVSFLTAKMADWDNGFL